MNGSSPRNATSQPFTVADEAADDHGHDEREQDGRAAEQAGRDDRGQAESGADTDVDAAGQHDDQLGQHDHADDRHLQQQIGQVGAAPKDRPSVMVATSSRAIRM